MVSHLSFFLAQELVDELVRHQGSVAVGKVSDTFSHLQHLCCLVLAARRNAPGQTRRFLNHHHHHNHNHNHNNNHHHHHHPQGSTRLLVFCR